MKTMKALLKAESKPALPQGGAGALVGINDVLIQ
jgi:hypothetical protein